MFTNKAPQRQLYAQVAGSSILEIVKLKKNYSKLLAKKIENIYKIINNSGKSKPYIRMTTKGLFCKQIIIPINKKNTNKLIVSFSNYITNINRTLKNIKLDVMVDYVWQEPIEVTIVTNKVALPSNIQVIKNIIKNMNNVNSEDIESSRLPQSKLYLKMIGILYFIENSNISIFSNFMELVIKSSYIFNNLLLASKL